MDVVAVSRQIKYDFRARIGASRKTVDYMVRNYGWREFIQTGHGMSVTGKVHLRSTCPTCVNTTVFWNFTNAEVVASGHLSICNICMNYN